MILAQATALADGGTVQLRAEVGELVITVFTSPSPLTVGPTDISLLLQNHDSLEPVLNADVTLLLRSVASLAEIDARPSRSRAQNKLLYAAPVTLPESGKWNLTLVILRNGRRTEATGTIHAAPASATAASYSSLLVLPPLMILLFAIRERLIRRR
jgi:hypothetical protein